jgi:hypothetical protein
VKLCGKCGCAAARRREVVGIDRSRQKLLSRVFATVAGRKLPPRERRAPQDFDAARRFISLWMKAQSKKKNV